MRRSIKYLAAAALAGLPAIAGAQSVQFVGATRGCFYTTIVCTPSGVFGSGSVSLFDANSVARVTYNYGGFNIYTQPSTPSGNSGAGIGGAGQNYGTATVSTGAAAFGVSGQKLLIEFMITGPSLPAGSSYITSRVYTMIGTVGTTAGSGGPSFFSSYIPTVNDIYVGAFTNGAVFGGGTASGTVDDWSWDTNNTTTGQTSPFTGRVDITSDIVTPEPASIGLLATGLFGLAAAGFRRRRSV
jgi:hypothetical protein